MCKLLRRVFRSQEFQWPVELDDYEKSIIDEVVGNNLTMTGRRRMVALAMAVRYLVKNRIPGDFVECGVWRGGASIVAQKLFTYHGDLDRRFFMYDTFAGMTEPADVDREASTDTLAIDLKPKPDSSGVGWCECSIEDVKKNIVDQGADLSSFVFVKGDICETLLETVPERCALLRLDTDWYESTKLEMEILYPKLVLGGVLHVDDYGHWQGARKAVDEYFSKPERSEIPLFSVVDESCRSAVKRTA